ncbi:conjugal transfer protein [Enterococcus faecalis]|uniref:conjugal transfer protein n=1 Tax=Enterococcus faecalis TaxID=1351 RepID=UPI00076FC158|nr:conjugal transfer protein [Enterococcus faecalis]
MKFEFKKKESDKSATVPKKRGIQAKSIKKIVWVSLIVLMLSGVGAYIKAMAVSNHLSEIQSSITKLTNDLSGEKKKNLPYTPGIQAFMDRFVRCYVNVPKDSNQYKERMNVLVSDFYAEDLKEDETGPNATRMLSDMSFVQLANVEGVQTATYEITYTIETSQKKIVETKKDAGKGKTVVEKKEIDDPQKVTNTELLNIPFAEEKNGMRVIAYPYFTLLKGNGKISKAITYQPEKMKLASQEETEEAEKFMNEFLEKYASSKAADMSYMMESPEGLNGAVTVDTAENNIYRGEGKEVLVKTDVNFRDKDTDIRQREQLTFHLIKKSGKYYVQKLTHTWAD